MSPSAFNAKEISATDKAKRRRKMRCLRFGTLGGSFVLVSLSETERRVSAEIL